MTEREGAFYLLNSVFLNPVVGSNVLILFNLFTEFNKINPSLSLLEHCTPLLSQTPPPRHPRAPPLLTLSVTLSPSPLQALPSLTLKN